MFAQLALNLALTAAMAWFGYRYFQLRDRLLQLDVPDLPYLQGVGELIDQLEAYSGDHSLRMAKEAEQIARSFHVPEDSIVALKIACFLHDCGQINLPRDMWRQSNKLSEDEWFLVKTHPLLGEIALRKSFPNGEVPSIVRWHHERWDGTGYPDQLMAREIPLTARILSVVDAAAAMADDRPYRNARSPKDIQEELSRQAGFQFDPMIVAARARLVTAT